jgi:hypothetical protein
MTLSKYTLVLFRNTEAPKRRQDTSQFGGQLS